MSGRERPAPHCRPPRKPTRNEVQRATTSDGDCCDGGEDSNGEDSNRDSEDSNGDGEDSNGDGNGDGSGNGSGNDELQRRRAVHFQHPAKSPRKQNRTHGPSAVKYSKSAGFRDLKTLPESFAALRHGTVFHLRSRTNSGGNRSRHECCTPLRQWNKGGSGSFPNQDIWIK